MRYTAKDLTHFFNVKKETLRYYEQVGLLSPIIGKNNYRYYHDWDVFMLAELRRLRAFDYSIKDIKRIADINNLGDLQTMMQDKSQYYKTKRDFYESLLTHNQILISYLNEPLNNFQRCQMPSLYLDPAYKTREKFPKNAQYQNFNDMNTNEFSLCDFMFSERLNDSSSYIGGTAFFKELLPASFNINHMTTIKSCSAWTINLLIANSLVFNEKDTALLLDKAKGNRIYVLHLGIVNGKRLVKVWIPYK
ncbi:MAG TPA: MerR family transcriptional regulator [Candidatus Limosilactobacillus intestinigallinarum]|nr:MerR family transcriptional regulator [Candidatus Limosilactobacillus intestinigallinarum]